MSTSVFQLVEFNDRVVDLDNTSVQLDAKSIQLEVSFSASEFADKFGVELCGVFANPEHTFYFLNQDGGVVSAKLERVSELSASKFKTRFSFLVTNWKVELSQETIIENKYLVSENLVHIDSTPNLDDYQNRSLFLAKFVRCGHLVLGFMSSVSEEKYTCQYVKLTPKAVSAWRSYSESGNVRQLVCDFSEMTSWYNLPPSFRVNIHYHKDDLLDWEKNGKHSAWGDIKKVEYKCLFQDDILENLLRVSKYHISDTLVIHGVHWNSFLVLFNNLPIKQKQAIAATIYAADIYINGLFVPLHQLVIHEDKLPEFPNKINGKTSVIMDINDVIVLRWSMRQDDNEYKSLTVTRFI